MKEVDRADEVLRRYDPTNPAHVVDEGFGTVRVSSGAFIFDSMDDGGEECSVYSSAGLSALGLEGVAICESRYVAVATAQVGDIVAIERGGEKSFRVLESPADDGTEHGPAHVSIVLGPEVTGRRKWKSLLSRVFVADPNYAVDPDNL